MKCLFATLAATQLLLSATQAAVIEGPVINPANGHAYFVISQNTWTGAEAEAQLIKGHLATINDEAEQGWVVSQFNTTATPRPLWIGFRDLNGTGVYTWVDGTPASYTNWYPGEPNNNAADRYAYILRANAFPAAQWNNIGDFNNDSGGPSGGQPIFGLVEVEVAPLTLSIEVSAVRLCWNSVTNQNYQIQYRSGLTTNMWTNIGEPVAGTGSVICSEQPASTTTEGRFYRVEKVD